MKTLNAILDFLFGKKYYFIVITRMGQEKEGYMTHTKICRNKQEIDECIRNLYRTKIFNYEWTESFRSHHNFVYDDGSL